MRKKKHLTIDILSLFPGVFQGYLNDGLMAKAVKKGVVAVNTHDIRRWSQNRHKTADDKPYGGGAGMVMMVEPIASAIKELKKKNSHVIVLSPRGTKLTQEKAGALSKARHLILVCGHYEGVDQRVADFYADEELSIGDYVLSGGEPAAIVLTDVICRLVPGFLGNAASLETESFEGEQKLLEFPQYTRPESYGGHRVPDVLLKGNHQEIKSWRAKKSLETTKKRRPDLIQTDYSSQP